ncbi:hypothetical protein IQ264_28200 [Phormidium sp. LEGE 05292]|nr:hypothetical protein [Phormidium sp. LEGE 05292]
MYAPWLAIPIWWLGQTDLLLGNSLLAKQPKSMNAVYWYEEWFETVENREAEENIEPTIEIVEPTITPEIVVQEVVQGKRKPKHNPASTKQMKLFNLDDFS